MFTLDRVGYPNATVMCYHGTPLDFINKWDYSLNPSQQTGKVTERDLDEWMKYSNVEAMLEHCPKCLAERYN